MREKGITETPHGYRARVRIHGELHQRRFPSDTPLVEIRAWLLKTEMRHRGATRQKTGRFEDDARAYLATVTAMPTYAQRAQHIEEWIAVFGQQRRDSITADQITAQLHAWRSQKRTITKRGGKEMELVLSAGAVNKRRSALMHLFTTLDGKAERNPVKDTPKFLEPAPAPRALTFDQLRKIFASMPSGRARAHLEVMAYTGIPPGQIATIRPEHVNLKAGTVAIPGRLKGKGTLARIQPLIPLAIAAFKRMAREDAWGRVSRTGLQRVFRRACVAAGFGPSWRPYDLRHSFGTEVFRRSGDIRATQILMGHSSPILTHRYTVAAQEQRVLTAVSLFSKRPK